MASGGVGQDVPLLFCGIGVGGHERRRALEATVLALGSAAKVAKAPQQVRGHVRHGKAHLVHPFFVVEGAGAPFDGCCIIDKNIPASKLDLAAIEY